MDAIDRGRRLFLSAPSAASLISHLRADTPGNSNTGVSKRQSTASASKSPPETGGCDWFEAGLYGSWDMESFQELASEFGALKRAALEHDEQPQAFELRDGTPAMMQARGVSMGWGGCEWVFDANGIRFFIVNRPWGSDDRLSVWFRATGETCMVLGHLTVFQEVLRILGLLGFRYARSSTPSRFDGCVDLAGWDLELIQNAWQSGCVVKRADKWKMEGEEHAVQTIEFGKRGGEQIVFYDKLAELRRDGPQGANDFKRAYLAEHRWGGNPDKALRVELRIRGDWLRRNTRIRSCEEFFACLPDLVERKLGHKGWFQVKDEAPDRENNHTARAKLAGWWEYIIQQFLSWAGQGADKVTKPVKRGLRMRELLKQTLGCLSTLAAVQDRRFDGREDIASWLITMMGDDAAGFLLALRDKERKLGASRAGGTAKAPG